ncbi:MAG: carboxypeptidase regulatory-like domain-containing protein [Bacteroidota bacterium]
MKLQFQKFLLVLIVISISSCKSPTEAEEIGIQEQPTITQGVWGKVKFWEGDFMPVTPSGKISPVERVIYIYQLTSAQQVEQVYYSSFYRKIFSTVVDSGWSNSKGFFQFALPEGRYSIFVKEDSLYYANRSDGQGNIFPFTVKKDSLTEIEFDITYKATF